MPQFNLGTNSGASCSASLREKLGAILAGSGASFVLDGRFKGGWITRSFGRPQEGVEAVQMELGCRGYMEEPAHIDEANWPSPFDGARASRIQPTLRLVLEAMLAACGA